jgi:hypothetical protein
MLTPSSSPCPDQMYPIIMTVRLRCFGALRLSPQAPTPYPSHYESDGFSDNVEESQAEAVQIQERVQG